MHLVHFGNSGRKCRFCDRCMKKCMKNESVTKRKEILDKNGRFMVIFCQELIKIVPKYERRVKFMPWDCPFCFLGWLHDQWGWDPEMAEKFRSMCPNK